MEIIYTITKNNYLSSKLNKIIEIIALELSAFFFKPQIIAIDYFSNNLFNSNEVILRNLSK